MHETNNPGALVESATVTLHLAGGTEQSEDIRHGRGLPDATADSSRVRGV